jgi:PKD repeat protein
MKQFIALLLALSPSCLIAQNCENPNATFEFVGNVQTYFCEGPNGLVTVDITVDQNNDPACIDRMILDWGDGTVQNLAANDFGNHTHIYYYPDSIACMLTLDQLNPDVKLTLIFKNGKLNKRTQSLAISPLPRASILAKAPRCVNKPIEFSVVQDCHVDSVRWDFGNGNISTLKNPTFTYPTGGVKSVELCVFNECGKKCVTQNIFILDPPDVKTLAATATPASGCAPIEVKMTATVQQVFDYDWSVVPLTPCTGCWQFVAINGKDSVAPLIRFTKEGIYRVSLLGKNDCGQDTLSTLVQVYGPPVPTFTGNPIGCKTFAYTPTYTVSNANPNSIATYQWSFPKGSPSTSTSANPVGIQYVNNGNGLLTDTVRLTVTGPCGTQTIQQIVRVYGDTEVKFQPIGQVCTGQQPFVLPVSPPPPLGSFSIVPATPALNLASGLLTPSLATPGDYTVTYTVNIAGAPPGCQSSGTATFTVKASAPVSLSAPDKFCVDAPAQTIALNPGSGGILTGKGVLDTLGNQYSPAKAGVGPDVLLFSYKDPATGCVSTASKPLEIVGIPSAKAPDTIRTCDIPQAVDLQTLGVFTFNPAPSGATKTWGGPGIGNPSSSQFSSPGVGVFPLKITYVVPPGCDTTVNFVVKVAPFVAATAGAAATVCKSQTTYTLSGQPGGGQWAGPSVHPTTGTIDLAALSPGAYSYTYAIAAGTPCASSATVSITVVGEGVSLGKTLDHICQTAASYTLPTPMPPTGSWSGPQLSGSTVTIAGLAVGPHTYTYTEPTLPDACNKIQFTLHIAEQPSADFALAPDTVCIGKNTTVSPLATSGATYSVDWGDGTPPGPALSHAYTAEGDFTITLTVRTAHPVDGTVLCVNVLSKKIHVVAPPQKLAFGMDKKKGCGPLAVTFTNQSVAENGQYRWQFGNFQTFDGEQPNTPRRHHLHRAPDGDDGLRQPRFSRHCDRAPQAPRRLRHHLPAAVQRRHPETEQHQHGQALHQRLVHRRGAEIHGAQPARPAVFHRHDAAPGHAAAHRLQRLRHGHCRPNRDGEPDRRGGAHQPQRHHQSLRRRHCDAHEFLHARRARPLENRSGQHVFGAKNRTRLRPARPLQNYALRRGLRLRQHGRVGARAASARPRRDAPRAALRWRRSGF